MYGAATCYALHERRRYGCIQHGPWHSLQEVPASEPILQATRRRLSIR